MSLLSRNSHAFPKEGLAQPESPPLGSMEQVGQSDPYSGNFVIPQWLLDRPTPGNLVRYLSDANKQKDFDLYSLNRIPYSGHCAGAKRLLEKYPLEVIVKAVWQCGQIARHAFTFAFVQKWLENNT